MFCRWAGVFGGWEVCVTTEVVLEWGDARKPTTKVMGRWISVHMGFCGLEVCVTTEVVQEWCGTRVIPRLKSWADVLLWAWDFRGWEVCVNPIS